MPSEYTRHIFVDKDQRLCREGEQSYRKIIEAIGGKNIYKFSTVKIWLFDIGARVVFTWINTLG